MAPKKIWLKMTALSLFILRAPNSTKNVRSVIFRHFVEMRWQWWIWPSNTLRGTRNVFSCQ